MSDKRYLKRRGESWNFRLRVPMDLRKHFEQPEIIQPLKTRDIREAQRKRWTVLAGYQEQFDRLRGKRALTPAEVEAEAQEAFATAVRSANPENFFAPVETLDDPYSTDSAHAGMEEALSQTLDCLRDDDYSSVKKHAEAIIASKGASMPEGTAEYQSLCHALLTARAESLKALIAARTGKVYVPRQTFNQASIDPVTGLARTPAASVARPAAAPGQRTVSAAAAAFVLDRQRDEDAAWSTQTKLQNEATYRLFAEFVKDCPIEAVGRTVVAEFLDGLATLHRDYKSRKELRGASIWKLLDDARGTPSLSNVTLNRHKSALSVLFRWCIRRGWHDGPNPAADQSRPRAKALSRNYLPFAVDELNTLFSGPPFQRSYAERTRPNRHTMQTTLAWIPLIGLFTGARSGEICQLRPEDVREEADIPYFNIAEEVGGQSVKTEAGVRRVPVHSMLIAAGFLEYAAFVRDQGETQLFPRLKPGGREGKLNAYFGKRFRAYRVERGIIRERVAFHSFRANAATALEAAKVPQHEAAQVIGHERKGMTYGRYSAGLGIAELKEAVEKITYPCLTLEHLTGEQAR